MVRLQASETFKQIPIDAPLKMRYAISNYGRLISYTNDFQDGRVLRPGLSEGYRRMHYRVYIDGVKKNKYIFLYKLIAEYFIPKNSDEQTNVLHLDHSRDNDIVSNLKWATRAEMLEHTRHSPRIKAAKLNQKNGAATNCKLTSTQVIRLKKRLLDPNRKTRVKMLAKEFGVSEMQLSRIRTGENWGHIKV